jgi:hypothetical protein
MRVISQLLQLLDRLALPPLIKQRGVRRVLCCQLESRHPSGWHRTRVYE